MPRMDATSRAKSDPEEEEAEITMNDELRSSAVKKEPVRMKNFWLISANTLPCGSESLIDRLCGLNARLLFVRKRNYEFS